MYQYSLASYLDVFELSLKKSMPDTILQKRLRNIMDTLTHNVYNYGCTGAAASCLSHSSAVAQGAIIQATLVRLQEYLRNTNCCFPSKLL